MALLGFRRLLRVRCEAKIGSLDSVHSARDAGRIGIYWRIYALFVGILLHKPSARVAYTVQVSVASVGHIPHLVPNRSPIADIAVRALTIVDPTWVCSSIGRPETTPLSRLLRLGFASPSLYPFSPLVYLRIPLIDHRIPPTDLHVPLLQWLPVVLCSSACGGIGVAYS